MFLPIAFVQQPRFEGNQFAISLDAGRDLNGDRIPDLVIGDGTQREGPDVWFISGKDGSVLGRRDSPNGPAHVLVDRLGDIDRDGSSEIAVSFRRWRPHGRAEILSGRSGAVLRTLRAEDFDLEECIVKAAGSIDDDGCPDLILAGNRKIDSSKWRSSVVAISGLTGSVIWRVTDEPPKGRILDSVSGVGDIDGDDRDDIAVAWQSDSSHLHPLVIYSGKTGLPLRELSGSKLEYGFGYSLDGGTDFDGDLRPDILVGSPKVGDLSSLRALVRVYSGRDGSVLRLLEGIDFPRPDGCGSDYFGECTRFVPDTNGDGVPELLVGSPEEGLFEGSAYLCSGKTGSILFAIEGDGHPNASGLPDGDRHVGRELAAAGDIDRDGVEDFAVANVPYDHSQFGLVRVFSGKTGKVLLRVDRDSLLRQKPTASTPR